MKYLPVTALLTLSVFFGACASSTVTPPSNQLIAQDVAVSLPSDMPRETVLLVSLDDGSVIKQTINSSADLCFKNNSDSSTTCLTQGAPVVDPVTNVVIGFQMIEDHIDLVAKSD